MLSTGKSTGLTHTRCALTPPVGAGTFRGDARRPQFPDEARGMTTNRKKLLLPDSMGRIGWDLLKDRDDIEPVGFSNTIKPEDFHKLLRDASGAALGVTPLDRKSTRLNSS